MIKSKFEEIFKQDMTEDFINDLMKRPLRKKFGDMLEQISSWKKFQPKPVNNLENKALTCIYLREYLI